MRKWLPRVYGTHHNTASTARNDKNPTREFRRINPGPILLKLASTDTVFEVDTITHLRLDTTPLPGNAQTAALSAFTDSVPDDHAPEVLLAHEQRDDAPLMPEQGPDLIGGIVTMDDATFTTLLTLHSGVSATSRFDCRAILDSYLAAGLIQLFTSP